MLFNLINEVLQFMLIKKLRRKPGPVLSLMNCINATFCMQLS